jgi:antitoxin Phd
MDMKGCVLLVDRKATSKASPTNLLRGFGYEVTTARGTDEALERLRERVFDLVISDIPTTAQTGASFLRRLRERQIDVPFLVLSDRNARERRNGKVEWMLFELKRTPGPVLLEETVARAIAMYRQLSGLRQAVAASRNVSARQVEVKEVSASDARNSFADLLETTARRGLVVINKQNTPKAVLLSFDDFSAMVARPTRTLDTLSVDFDKMLARMQKPGARAGMKKAFGATPEELGAAALAGAVARKRHA